MVTYCCGECWLTMLLCCREIRWSVAWECHGRFAPSYRFTPALNILRGIHSAKFLQVRKHEKTVSPSLDIPSHSYSQLQLGQ